MRLLLTELRRFWSRRITWLTLLVVASFMMLGVGIAFFQTDGAEPEEEQVITDPGCTASFVEARDNGDPEFDGLSDEEIEEQYCTFVEDNDRRFFATTMVDAAFGVDWDLHKEGINETSTLTVDGEQYRTARFGFQGILPGIGVFLLIVAVVLGGSFVGAEYRAGTVENLLLWEPRRLRVLGTKYAAGYLSSFVVMILSLGFLTGLLVLLANFRGTFGGTNDSFWVDLVLVLVRAGAVAGLFFVLAMAIANIARNTTAAVAVLLGWFVVSNIVIELLARQITHFELFTNASSFIGWGEVSQWVGPSNAEFVFAHGPWTAAMIVAIWAAVPAVLAAALFQRRDLS